LCTSGASRPAAHHEAAGAMSAQTCFACSPASERLADELARLVGGTCVVTHGVAGIMILANNATVPASLPPWASDEAVAWWQTEVQPTLGDGRRPARRRGVPAAEPLERAVREPAAEATTTTR
jgi:hypothetical protein